MALLSHDFTYNSDDKNVLGLWNSYIIDKNNDSAINLHVDNSGLYNTL